MPGSRLSARSTPGRRIMGIRGAAFQCGLRGPRGPQTHQRNGLAHVPGRDVLRTDGTRKLFRQLVVRFSATAFRLRLSGVCRGLGVEVCAGLQHRMHDHRQLPGQAARLKPSRFLNASCAARSRRARASASPWRPQRVGSAVAPPRDVSLIIDLARLVAPRRHPGADIA